MKFLDKRILDKRILAVFLALAIVVGFLVVSGTPQKTTATKIRIGDWPAVNGLPEYLALEKGYFKEAGLDVERVKFETPSQLIDASLQGKIDFGTAMALGITAIVDQKNPGKLKVFAVSGGTKNATNESLIVPISSSISSFKDLRGKKLGIPAGTIQWRTIARDLLAINGLDMDKDLEIVELTPALQVQALAAKQVDALLALEPIPTIAVGKNVATVAVNGPAEQFIADPFYPGALAVNAEFAKNNPETTKKVMAVFDRAMKEISENPDAARQYLKGYTSLTDDIASKVPISIFKNCSELDANDFEAIKKFYDIFSEYNVVDQELNFNNLSYCNSD